ncbi:TniQ family protein [Marinobacter sp. DUT-1]|uniref:TniQ family protein n=1 Tax=Marinobacter sp. DUT-1 TaxID=3412037 RepID=UPI003D181F32
MKRFALRPEPYPDESFNGFLLRVGKLNCVFKPTEILDCLGIQTTAASGHSGWLEAPSRETFRALERRLERPLESHRVRFKARDQLPWLRSKHRMISDLRLGFPRICPSCVSEQGFLDWRWGLAVTAHCPKHERLLIENCPSCHKKLNWDGSLLIGCPDCEKNWDDMELSRASEVTETELHLWKEMGSESGDLDESRLRDICLAISVAMRPFDLIHERVKHCPSLTGHSDFVRRAYLLLESPDMNASWRKQCHQSRKAVRFLGTDFVEAPCNVFSAHLEQNWRGPHEEARRNDETPAPKHNFPEVTEYISQSRRDRKLESKGSSGYRYHVTVQSFAEITGMSMESAQDFFRGDALIAHKNVRFSRRRRFDLRQFRGVMRALPDPEDSIEIFPNNPAFKKHLTTFGQLANDVILRRIPGGFSKARGIQSLFLNRCRFEKWLTDQLFRNAKRELKLEQVTEALDCTTQNVRDLVKADVLKWAKSQNGKPRVRGRSFCEHVMLSARAR